MSKVTGKRQITIPKAVADAYGIGVGTELAFEPAGDVIHLRPRRDRADDADWRLRQFDLATARQRERDARVSAQDGERGWTREDLYARAVPR